MIRCKAIVNEYPRTTIIPFSDLSLTAYRVEVWGEEPNDYVRIYKIFSKTEDEAAREGVDKFQKDVTSLKSQGS